MTDSDSPRYPVRDAIRARRSHSKVTDVAPTTEELGEILTVLSSVADHSSLRPWRIIELRGDRRDLLGRALAQAHADDYPEDADRDDDGYPVPTEKSLERYIGKARRSPLLLAIVARVQPSKKVPDWEQEAVAAGVAHYLGLLLQEAGWGSMWRTGLQTRGEAVRRAHRLTRDERLLGWLYVGGIPDRDRKSKPRKPLESAKYLSAL
ncbi:nitroreductase family protein [Leucobacter sp. GX24907]